MFRGRGNIGAETPQHEQAVAVAIDKDRGSEHAIKWAVDNLLSRGQSLTLLHVRHSISGQTESKDNEVDVQSEEFFLSFRSFCAKKNIKCNEVVLQDNDIPNALIKYVNTNSIEVLVLGTSTRTGLFRFRLTDVPGTVTKLAPDFCSVYVIAKGKVSCVRCSSAAPPQPHPRTNHKTHSQTSFSQVTDEHFMQNQRIRSRASERSQYKSANQQSDDFQIKSPFGRGCRGSVDKSFELSPEMDISFVSAAGRPSVDRMFPSFYDCTDSGTTPQFSQPDVENRNSTSPNPRNKATEMSSRHTVDMENRSTTSSNPRSKSMEMINSPHRELSSSSAESGKSGSSPHSTMEDVENEMRRLRLELKQTMDMCSMACKDALSAKHRENEFNRWKMDDGQRLLEDARMSEEAALALVEREKAKSKAAMEAAAAAQMIAELEAQKRRIAEMKAHKESEERKKAIQARSYDVRYRKYTIEDIEAATGNFSASRKIGEGGYGPVYKGELDHTSVAIKVLRPDAAQGKSQFQQEVEVLSCIRHPNMVLLLGACPEFGCLVYEHMANGSLDDRLFRRGNTPVIPWQLRFRIAAEIATGLLFLHQSKPEPLVHRDLKPGNILLDNNYVSKISDVGLARLVPPSVADSVTQYHMTSTAGTFCYIDPEYQQTGMLGTKSDIYSLGVVLLQIITARPPMGLTHHVERAIEMGTFSQMLDPAVRDWPVEEVLRFAKLSLQCAEMRRKDRPDLGKVVLPELNRLRAFAEESWNSVMLGGGGGAGVHSPGQGSISTSQDVISRPPSGYDSSRSRSSTASNPGRT